MHQEVSHTDNEMRVWVFFKIPVEAHIGIKHLRAVPAVWQIDIAKQTETHGTWLGAHGVVGTFGNFEATEIHNTVFAAQAVDEWDASFHGQAM